MTGAEMGGIALLVTFLATLTYAVNRLMDEHEARLAESRDATYWATLQRQVIRAHRDFGAGAR